MKSRMLIPKEEYGQRIKRVQSRMQNEEIDVILTHACECESANVRYLSGFWAVFDFVGVLIPRAGNAILLTGGPESYDYAVQFAYLDDIRIHPLYVETSAPEWDKPTNTYDFKTIFDEFRKEFKIKRIAIANSNIIPHNIYEDLRCGAPDAEIIEADDIIMKERVIKSTHEIELLKEAYRITEEATKQTIEFFSAGIAGMGNSRQNGVASPILWVLKEPLTRYG